MENKRLRKVTRVGGEKQKDFEVPCSLKHHVISPFIVYHVPLGWNLYMTVSSQILSHAHIHLLLFEVPVCL